MEVSSMTEEPKQEDMDAQESEERSRGDKTNGFVSDNPTLVLTLLYLYVTGIGMLYSALLYRRFGINIFDYSEIADFLLAAFKNPIALLVVVVQVALFLIARVVAGIWMAWIRTRSEREGVYEAGETSMPEVTFFIRWATSTTLVLLATGSLMVPYAAANGTASSIKRLV